MTNQASDLMPIKTEDGFKTLYSGRFGEHYHSVFGARNESLHVFINAGYRASSVNPVSVMEIGFGTGLNAWETLLEAEKEQCITHYESIELYPIDLSLAQEILTDPLFLKLHSAEWEKSVQISPYFFLHKRKADLLTMSFFNHYDVVYFDAFSPAVQPEMWTLEIFTAIYQNMNPQGILTTYSAKGSVRRAMQAAGFMVERIAGPAGKREMLRARKAI